MSLSRKLARKNKAVFTQAQSVLTEKEYNAILTNAAELMVGKTILVACEILENNYGKLRNKATRSEVFAELFLKNVNNCNVPSLRQEELAVQLQDKGLRVVFEN